MGGFRRTPAPRHFFRRARLPDVLWAERKDKLFITIEVPDCKDAKVDITEEGKLTFSGRGGTDNVPYACELQLLKPVDSKARPMRSRRGQRRHRENNFWKSAGN